MFRHALIFLILIPYSICYADDWNIVPSVDRYWIKTINNSNHELIVIRNQNKYHFMLILAAGNLPTINTIPVKIVFDKDKAEERYLKLLEKRNDKSIFELIVDDAQKEYFISRMISGLKINLVFDKNTRRGSRITFSLKGFTVALNELLIADDIGSLDQDWLLENHKDHELFCYKMSNISITAIQYRLNGYNYSRTLHSIEKTGHSIIDNNLANIIQQVYNIPKNDLPSEPRAEKYIIFRNCFKQKQQPIH